MVERRGEWRRAAGAEAAGGDEAAGAMEALARRRRGRTLDARSGFERSRESPGSRLRAGDPQPPVSNGLHYKLGASNG